VLVSTKIVDLGAFFRYWSGMTPEQCRAARAWLDIGQDVLASAAGVSLSTVRDFEKGRRNPIANNLRAIQAALEQRGIAFVDDEGTSGIAFSQLKK